MRPGARKNSLRSSASSVKENKEQYFEVLRSVSFHRHIHAQEEQVARETGKRSQCVGPMSNLLEYKADEVTDETEMSTITSR